MTLTVCCKNTSSVWSFKVNLCSVICQTHPGLYAMFNSTEILKVAAWVISSVVCCIFFVRYIMTRLIKNMKSWFLCLATELSKSTPAVSMKVCKRNNSISIACYFVELQTVFYTVLCFIMLEYSFGLLMFIAPCEFWGSKYKACSISWLEVIKGVPNQGIVFGVS